MIEQWVIGRPNPLKGERLIILADPQRMIRAGAQAVDGWAKENGFTVLFCSGNLGLREMYENQEQGQGAVRLIDSGSAGGGVAGITRRLVSADRSELTTIAETQVNQ